MKDHPILIHGMHGLGDSLHQRALLRQLMPRYEVFLESSWVAPYHDLIADGLKVIRKASRLRTQDKNADREAKLFAAGAPSNAKSIRVWYAPEEVRRHRSVLGAMCAATGCDESTADFRLPVRPEWVSAARAAIGDPGKPIMVVRPLVERTEWDGCAARNPDQVAYRAIHAAIRDRFHVVSIADLVPNVEWAVEPLPDSDVSFHRGELPFETLAGLFSIASLTFCSPGFAAILSQAVGVPVITVFGGYERGYSFSSGARFAPYLPIEPIHPRDDFKHASNIDKTIDSAAAIAAARLFADQAIERRDRAAA